MDRQYRLDAELVDTGESVIANLAWTDPASRSAYRSEEVPWPALEAIVDFLSTREFTLDEVDPIRTTLEKELVSAASKSALSQILQDHGLSAPYSNSDNWSFIVTKSQVTGKTWQRSQGWVVHPLFDGTNGEFVPASTRSESHILLFVAEGPVVEVQA